MNNKVVENIKREDKAALKKFFIIMICAILAGGVVGFFVGFGRDYLNGGEVVCIREAIIHICPYVPYLMVVLALPVTTVVYVKSRKGFNNWDEEDEEYISKINGTLDIANMIINTSVVITTAFFLITASQMFSDNTILNSTEKGLGFIGFYLELIPALLMQQRILNLKKEINPGKRGSAFDIDGLKKWLASCDEAEKVALYRCGFTAFRAVLITCGILAIVYFFAMFVWDLSIIPVFIIGIIALVALTTYSIEEIKNSYRG